MQYPKDKLTSPEAEKKKEFEQTQVALAIAVIIQCSLIVN